MGKRERCPILENSFQANLIKEIKERLPGAMVLKNDSGYMQGVPDLIVLYENNWAMLEIKTSSKSPHRPNQDYYITRLNSMSFAAFIFPENKEEILDELAQSFGNIG